MLFIAYSYPTHVVFGFMPEGYDAFSCKELCDEDHAILRLGLPLLVLNQKFFDQTWRYPQLKDRRLSSSSSTVQGSPEEFARIGFLYLLKQAGNDARSTSPQRPYSRGGHRNGKEFHCRIIGQQRSQPLVPLGKVFLRQ